MMVFVAAEKATQMAVPIDHGASKRNFSGGLLHDISPLVYREPPRWDTRMHHACPLCPTDTLVCVDTFVQ